MRHFTKASAGEVPFERKAGRFATVGNVMRAIIHVDMDAFYASVEQRDNPALQGKPLIVGGHAQRGVVLAASYEVRPFGVRSAMPMARALKLAPHAVIVRPRFSAYSEASEQVFAIFERYTPLVEPLSRQEYSQCVPTRNDIRSKPGKSGEAEPRAVPPPPVESGNVSTSTFADR